MLQTRFSGCQTQPLVAARCHICYQCKCFLENLEVFNLRSLVMACRGRLQLWWYKLHGARSESVPS